MQSKLSLIERVKKRKFLRKPSLQIIGGRRGTQKQKIKVILLCFIISKPAWKLLDALFALTLSKK